MDMRNDGRLWTRMSDVQPGFVPIAVHYAVVGCEDADPAVARIISVDIEGGIQASSARRQRGGTPSPADDRLS
jgi:hypothetical protein